MSNLRRYNGSKWVNIPLDSDKLGGTTLEQIQGLISGKVDSTDLLTSLSRALTTAQNNKKGGFLKYVYKVNTGAQETESYVAVEDWVLGSKVMYDGSNQDIGQDNFSNIIEELWDSVNSSTSSDDVICNIRDQDFDQGTLSNYLDELYDRIYKLQNGDSIPKATTSKFGGIKLGYGENNKNYAVKLDADGKAYVSVPWTSSGSSSSYSLPEASSTVRGGVMLTAGHSGDSNVYESYFDVKVESTNYHVFIRAGRFKQASGSVSSTTQFTFKKAMTTFGSSASKVSVILGDSSGQSTSGGYMGSLAVDSASSTGFKYRASNTEKGYVFYLALGTY